MLGGVRIASSTRARGALATVTSSPTRSPTRCSAPPVSADIGDAVSRPTTSAIEGADSLGLLAEAYRQRNRGGLRARQRRLRPRRPGAEDRAASRGDARAAREAHSASIGSGSTCVRRRPTRSASPAAARVWRRRRSRCLERAVPRADRRAWHGVLAARRRGSLTSPGGALQRGHPRTSATTTSPSSSALESTRLRGRPGAGCPPDAGGTTPRSAPASAAARRACPRRAHVGSGQTAQRGMRARHTVAPRSIRACAAPP